MLALDVVDPETGEVHRRGGPGAHRHARSRSSARRRSARCRCSSPSGRAESTLIKNTLAKDPTHNENDALQQIYSLLRPGDAPNLETARQALERCSSIPKRYDLGRVGRYKINQRLGLNDRPSDTVLTKEDFVAIIRYLVELHEGRGYTDDIDHLGNRRIRSVGELIANQFSRRSVAHGAPGQGAHVDQHRSEKISLDDLVNARTVSAVIQAFFGSSQLSQFMDQTNPLAELTHKRRLSALGPGGLTRERAGFEVRDVHYSQYGRMCPIETPEGPNIGLITSLDCYARVNDLGFVETPYRVVKNGKVTERDRVARREPAKRTQSSRRPTRRSTPTARSPTSSCSAGSAATSRSLPPERIDYMDVAPEQLVSIAAALIPFLEHDDANRALMGSNMQRQAVPLLFPRGAARRHGARGEGGARLGRVGDRRAARGHGHARHGRRDHRRRRA